MITGEINCGLTKIQDLNNDGPSDHIASRFKTRIEIDACTRFGLRLFSGPALIFAWSVSPLFHQVLHIPAVRFSPPVLRYVLDFPGIFLL